VDLGARGHARFVAATGRHPRPEDYQGVHTTGKFDLAGIYALQTTERTESSFGPDEPYPVVLQLDVRGLRALPDVDALMEGYEQFDESIRKIVEDELDEGQYAWQIAERLSGDGDFEEEDEDAWFAVSHTLTNAAEAVLEAVGDDEKKARRVLERWVRTGQVPEALLTYVVDQRRFMHDFGTERLVSVQAVKPLWKTILPSWDEDEQVGRRVGKLEARGWSVMTRDDGGDSGLDSREIWRNPRFREEPRRTQYHGTSSLLAARAFPEVPWPREAPFPIGRPARSP
jgi:hypothetical protein